MAAELRSGDWQGFWTTFEMPQRHPMQFQLKGAPEKIEAGGRDEVGEFTLTGAPGGPGEWILSKRYVGQHDVRYEARAAGEGLVGRWSIEGVCGGAVALWPGNAPAPPAEILAAVPKVELLSRSIWWALVLLDWGVVASGLLSLYLYARSSSTRVSLFAAFSLFAAYIAVGTLVQQWLARRVIRQKLGRFGANLNTAGGGWKKPVTPSQLWGAILTVAVLLYILWLFHQKAWPGARH